MARYIVKLGISRRLQRLQRQHHGQFPLPQSITPAGYLTKLENPSGDQPVVMKNECVCLIMVSLLRRIHSCYRYIDTLPLSVKPRRALSNMSSPEKHARFILAAESAQERLGVWCRAISETGWLTRTTVSDGQRINYSQKIERTQCCCNSIALELLRYCCHFFALVRDINSRSDVFISRVKQYKISKAWRGVYIDICNETKTPWC